MLSLPLPSLWFPSAAADAVLKESTAVAVAAEEVRPGVPAADGAPGCGLPDRVVLTVGRTGGSFSMGPRGGRRSAHPAPGEAPASPRWLGAGVRGLCLELRLAEGLTVARDPRSF